MPDDERGSAASAPDRRHSAGVEPGKRIVIQAMPLKRLALSAHVVGLMGAAFLIALAASWPALALARRRSRIAALAAVYGFFGGWIVYFLAAATGTGGMFPIRSGNIRGSAFLEGVMSAALMRVALALIALCGFVLKRAKPVTRGVSR